MAYMIIGDLCGLSAGGGMGTVCGHLWSCLQGMLPVPVNYNF